MSHQPSSQGPKSPEPKADLAGRVMSAAIGATAAVSYSAVRGQSLVGCLIVMSAAVVFTLVLDELGWV